jgi:glycosyltransferase involved in cell wall biosynthesis
MREQATVAVVIPAYNAAATLTATIDSAIAQGPIAEIVVIDDGSRDETLSVARMFEPRVRVLTGPNVGVSAARNRGVAETRAPWVLFLDSDDQLVDGSIAQRLATPGADTADVVICDWQEMVDDGQGNVTEGRTRAIDWVAMTADAQHATATDVWATTSAIMYRRALVDRIGGFRADLPVIQDARYLFDAAYHGARFLHAPHVGARYRVVPGSLSRRDPGRFWADVLLNGKQIEALWRAHGALTPAQTKALAGIYNHAARGLFAARHPAYLEAVDSHRALGLPLPLHSRVAGPLAQAIGQRSAQVLLSIVGRG